MTNRRIFQGPVAWLALLLAFAAPVAALTEDDGYQPSPNGPVHSLTSTAHGTLVGGNFTAINGVTRGRWAMLNSAGRNTSYNQVSLNDGVVRAGLATTNSSGATEIVIAGSFSAGIMRLDVFGLPVSGWSNPNPDGMIRALAEKPNPPGAPGIYIAGEFSTVNGQTRRRVALLNANGQHSTSFLPPNFTGTAHALAVQDDGKVLVGGSLGIVLTPQRLYRLNPDGSLDSSFQPVSMSSGNRTVYAIEIEDDGRILVAGALDGNGFIARLNEDGSLDGSYTPPSLNGPVYALDLLPDGRAVIGGDFTTGVGLRSRIARLNENGSVDNSFAFFINPNGTVRAVLVQDDGSVLIGGGFNQIGNLGRNRLARLDARGVVDQSLVVDANFSLLAVALERDGRILVGGSFSEISGSNRSRMVRLNPNGSVNSSYAPTLNGNVETMAVQRDGRVLIGGGFGSVNGVARRRMARLHSDGSLDASFEANFNQSDGWGNVNAIHLYDDGRMLVGGYFDSVNGQPREGLVRLFPNGAVDPDFDPIWLNTDKKNGVSHFVVDDVGWIYAGGDIVRPDDGSLGRESTLALLSPSGQQSPSFLPVLGELWRNLYPSSAELIGESILVGGQMRYRLSALGPWQRTWSVLDAAGNHTISSPFSNRIIYTIHKRGSGLWIGGLFYLGDAPEKLGVGLMNSAGDALQAGLAPFPLTAAVSSGQMTPDGRFLAALGRIVGDPGPRLKRIANPDGLPLRQRVVWGTPGNPERLRWERLGGFGSAPAVLGTPRVLVSQTCCNPAHFQPAAGGGWMSADGSHWRLDDFQGLPGKFYVRIEYRVGNSKSSSTFLTPIQRFYGEVPPATPTADLALRLVPNLDELQVAPGDIFIASFLASNGGPDTATQTGAQIDIPVGYTLLGHNAGSGTDFIVEEGFWKVNNLTPGQGAQLELQLQVTQERGHTLSGAFHGQQFDPDHNNNLTEATPEVLFSQSDLKLAHTVDPQFALPGHEAIFTVLVENLGPDPASGVEVNYLRPTGYSYGNHNASQGSYNSASGLWQVGTLAAGQSATLLVRTQVNGSGGFTSSAQVSSHSEDPEPFNNLAFAAVDPFTDLALDIQADTDAATLNEQVMLSITVDNNGPREADATSVLLEPLAGGLMPVDHFVTHGDYEPTTGVWSIGPLAPGESAQMHFEGQVIVLQDTVMAATVGSDAYELVPGDESGSVTILYGQPGEDAIFADGFEEGGTE